MREIKFRAWKKSENRTIDWYELGELGKIPDRESHNPPTLYDVLDGTYLESVMQYTGLKDKNGKEIYEGDILQDDCAFLLEVKFGKLPLDKSGDCVCTFPAFFAKCYGKLGQSPSHECEEIGKWMEIIGNIYANPELIPGCQVEND